MVFRALVLGLGLILGPMGCWCCLVGVILLLFGSVILDGAVVVIKCYFCAAARATTSALVGVLGVICGVGADPIA